MARALQFTDIKEIRNENITFRAESPAKRSPQQVKETYSNTPLFVLLCEVALGKPLFVNARHVGIKIKDLSAKEKEEKNQLETIIRSLGKFWNYFKLIRYQKLGETLVMNDDDLTIKDPTNCFNVDEMIEEAKKEGCDSVVTCNAPMEPVDARLWQARVLPDGQITYCENEECLGYNQMEGVDYTNRIVYGEAFVWDAKQVAVRYIVEFKADHVNYLDSPKDAKDVPKVESDGTNSVVRKLNLT